MSPSSVFESSHSSLSGSRRPSPQEGELVVAEALDPLLLFAVDVVSDAEPVVPLDV